MEQLVQVSWKPGHIIINNPRLKSSVVHVRHTIDRVVADPAPLITIAPTPGKSLGGPSIKFLPLLLVTRSRQLVGASEASP